MPRFTTEITVRFNHVDPAGIVYYPRYYEMINQTSEIWFEEAIGYPYPQMIADGWTVPLAHMESSFKNPSYLNDRLTFALGVRQLGRSRIDLDFITSCQGEVRFMTRQSIIWIDHKKFKSARIPDDIRHKMEAYLLADGEAADF
ncbi:acyl-CoA thioesterase [Paremcibacter congregatus]|uniref:Thioesterase n=1 Tax=Paremcibacter congregatus TaxID=2043170 RepID=A0A2G4YP23_9PROT|nr:thioesterase family protein [Paremcibacter congregatus]PHZ84045.1 thioesterase [Paremcibacter congregatus]QDE25894.1 acyl-CoA thioesterase [Paremcibacter congregatus]|tara:strand:+ start:11626 stop:12057 length:432 start_codon:yes stop_codon:yes gene_type:complete